MGRSFDNLNDTMSCAWKPQSSFGTHIQYMVVAQVQQQHSSLKPRECGRGICKSARARRLEAKACAGCELSSVLSEQNVDRPKNPC